MELNGRKVLVTGADGFIGSHLVERLMKEGCSVRALVLYNSNNSWGWLDSFSKEQLAGIEIFAGDIRDPNFVKEAAKGMDLIFHLAALIAIPYSYHAPDSYVDTNIRGTLNILQAARDLGTKRILVTSTSEVYGTAQYVPIDEKHPRQPQSPYSATKIAADCMAESFYRSFNLPVTIVRPFNTFGPRQSARAIIPTIITQLLSGHEKLKLGDLEPTRDLVYVQDTVEGFVSIAREDKLIGEDVNIATNSEITVGQVAELLIKLINPKAAIELDEQRIRPAKSEVYRLFGDNKKLKELTNWAPNYSFSEAIKETVEWFRIPENLSRYKADIYNV